MNTIKACIFDLDGVLVDTAIYHFQAWRKLARSLGSDFTEADNEKLKGISRIESLRLILKWAGIEKQTHELEELASLKNSWYLEMISEMDPNELLPGSRDFLIALKNAGFKIGLGSASKNARVILEKTQLLSFFDAIVDGTIVSLSKPNPTVFLHGADLLKVKPEDCVVFEDAVAGVEAAKIANMRVIGVGDKNSLKKADKVVSSLADLKIEDLYII